MSKLFLRFGDLADKQKVTAIKTFGDAAIDDGYMYQISVESAFVTPICDGEVTGVRRTMKAMDRINSFFDRGSPAPVSLFKSILNIPSKICITGIFIFISALIAIGISPDPELAELAWRGMGIGIILFIIGGGVWTGIRLTIMYNVGKRR